MRQNDKVLLGFFMGLFSVGLLTFTWGIAKSAINHWQIFSISWVAADIWVGLVLGLYFMFLGVKEYLYYRKHKRIEHGCDERNWKMLTYSLRNVGVGLLLFNHFAYLYYSLYNDYETPIFTVNSLNWIAAVGVTIFFVSEWYYSRSKKL